MLEDEGVRAMPRVSFGRKDISVTAVGLGGEGVLRTTGRQDEARAVIFSALDNGIGYFDSARVYADSELYLGSVWRELPQVRRTVFQTSKSASRDAVGARQDLEQSLRRLQTDYLDLWQIHDIRTVEDCERLESPKGALETFAAAKKEGLIRFIGVTAHHDPTILLHAVNNWPIDAVLLPVNPIEAVLGGFLDDVCEAARNRGCAVIAMKVLGAGHYILPEIGVSAEALLHFARSFPITLPIVGCSSPQEVRILAERGFDDTPLSRDEKDQIISRFRPYAQQLAYYRGTHA